MYNDKLRIKWAGPNTPFIELQRTDDRLYCTKMELLAIMDGIREFILQYPENFTANVIENYDNISDEEDI